MSVSRCERCGSLNGLTVDRAINRYEIPEQYDVLCSGCAEEVNTHTAEEMSDDALIAAIVDDSIGYATPHHAADHVEQFREGERFAWCERARSCFPMDPDEVDDDERSALTGGVPGDLHQLIERARRKWCAMDEDRQERLLEFVEQWREAEEPGTISGVSMAYPTLGI